MKENPIRLRRVLLKISGESFGSPEDPFESEKTGRILDEVAEVHRQGVELGMVMGGGNILRGAALERKGFPRAAGDAMGMLATAVNAVYLSELLAERGVRSRILTSFEIQGIGEFYRHDACREHLRNGCVVLFAGGTGHPYFTTDTAAALRAAEIGAECFLKGTKVDGVYSGEDIPRSTKFDFLTYAQAIENRYRVMDLTAVSFCMENRIPIRVFNLMQPGNLLRIVNGEHVGTLIGEAGNENGNV